MRLANEQKSKNAMIKENIYIYIYILQKYI